MFRAVYNTLAADKRNDTSNNPKEKLIAENEEHKESRDVDKFGLFDDLNLSTKEGRNLTFIIILGLACTLDVVVTNLSIQPFYYILAYGNNSTISIEAQNLYGFANGVYWLAQFVGAPVFGYVVDKTQSYKLVFFVGLLLQGLGNLLYTFLYVIEQQTSLEAWKLLIVSRAVQGFGSAVVITGSTYITSFVKAQDRASVLGRYRYSQIITRFVGAFLAFAFIGLPEPNSSSPFSVDILNFYTTGSWVALGLISLTALACIRLFEEPHVVGNGENSPAAAKDTLTCSEFVDRCHQRLGPNGGSIWTFVAAAGAVQLFQLFSVYSVVSQVFGFSVAYYKVVAEQVQIYKPWLGFGVGSMLGSYVWKKVTPMMDTAFPERRWTTAGQAASVAAMVFLLPFATPVVPFMYIGYCLLAVGLSWFSVNQVCNS
jgi:MFS family permease